MKPLITLILLFIVANYIFAQNIQENTENKAFEVNKDIAWAKVEPNNSPNIEDINIGLKQDLQSNAISIAGEHFEKLYGNNLSNTFGKAILFQNNYYILGSNNLRATISKIDIMGNLLYTVEVNNTSAWLDLVVNKDGNILIVGRFGEFATNVNSQSMVGVLNPLTGSYILLQTYDLHPSRETFIKIYSNPNPSNTAFPYYISGWQATATIDDATISSLANNGTSIGFHKILNNGDDEFGRDIEVDANAGSLMLVGNTGSNGITLTLSNTGNYIRGRLFNTDTRFTDAMQFGPTQPTYNHLLAGPNISNNEAHIYKVNTDGVIYSYKVNGLTTITKLFPDTGNDFFALGYGVFGGVNRPLILNFTDNGNSLSFNYAKTFNGSETEYGCGYAQFVTPTKFLYTDSRTGNPNGFGNQDAFFSILDSDLSNCLDESIILSITPVAVSFSSFAPTINVGTPPQPIDRTAINLTYNIADACAVPCNFVFTHTNLPCGKVQFNTDFNGVEYCWNFGDGTGPCNSNSPDPMHTFTENGTYTVCLSAIVNEQTCEVCNTVTITSADNDPPVVNCPQDKFVDCGESTASSVTGLPTVIFDLNSTSIQQLPDVFEINTQCLKVIERTFVITDACGNSTTCLQIIRQEDITDPSIECSANITISCYTPNNQNFGIPQASDNCGEVTLIRFDQIFTGTNCNGSVVNWWRATDVCGNKSECSQTITIDDEIKPEIICPPDLTISCNQSTDPMETGYATASDNCTIEIFPFKEDVIDGPLCNQTIIRTWSVVDECGNANLCTQLIMITNNIDPEINCPEKISISCEISPIPSETGVPNYSDDCTSIEDLQTSYTDNGYNGNKCFDEFERIWTVTDNCGNSSSCIQLIIVQDTIRPAIICPMKVTVSCINLYNLDFTGEASFSDNCDESLQPIFNDETINQEGCIDEIIRTWTVTDDCGNSNSCAQLITTTDTIRPTLSNCPRNITVSGIFLEGECIAQVNLTSPTASDSCSEVVIINSNQLDDLFPSGTTTVIWTASDSCGNTSTCQTTVTVVCEQGSECIEIFDEENTTFNTPSVSNWTTLNGQVAIFNDPTKGSHVLLGSDQSGASWMLNKVEYSGDWTMNYNTCEFCFDIRYDGGASNPGAGPNAIYIYNSAGFPGAGQYAYFHMNTPIVNQWTRVCVPTRLSSGGLLPSNSQGTWMSPTPALFDNIITNVVGIGFPLDFAGGSNPVEKLFIDSLCLENCGANEEPCGYTCCPDDEDKEDVFDELPLGNLTAFQTGWIASSGTPQVVLGGCKGSSKSVELKAATIFNPGDGIGYEVGGILGSQILYKKDIMYCVKFCVRQSTKSTFPALLNIFADDTMNGNVLIHTVNTIPSSGTWIEYHFFYTPTEDLYSITFLNASGPGTPNMPAPAIRIDDICISKAIPVYNDTTPPNITCPMDVVLFDYEGDCLVRYKIPEIIATDDNGIESITCTLDGVVVTPGQQVGLSDNIIHTIVCTAIDVCGNKDTCSYTITVDCKDEACPEICQSKFDINLSTGVDANGIVIPSGIGSIDPFWNLINNSPVLITCTSPLVPADGNSYITNYVFPSTSGWVNQPGVGVLSPYNQGNNNSFGCNNLNNADNTGKIPYIFERTFCLCQPTEINLDLYFRGDDQLRLELWNLTTNTLIGMSSTYIFPSTTGHWVDNFSLTANVYGLRAYLVNTQAVTLGFSVSGGITSLSDFPHLNEVGKCCMNENLAVQKILDTDCNGNITSGDVIGQGWTFNLLQNGSIVATGSTDVNGEVIFTGLQPGNYTLQEITQPGWIISNPTSNPINISVTSGGYNIFQFFNCPSPMVDCDSLMAMTTELPSECFDQSIITGITCPTFYMPVCGCNGVTYDNECLATEAGITTYTAGICHGVDTETNPPVVDTCCHRLDLKNNWRTDISSVQVNIITPDWVFENVTLNSPFYFGPCTPMNNTFCVYNPLGSIPEGMFNALDFCLSPTNSTASSTQMVEIVWMQNIGENEVAVCRDTIIFECENENDLPCVTVDNIETTCTEDPNVYEMCFNITNNSGQTLSYVTLQDLNPGFTFVPTPLASKLVFFPGGLADGASYSTCILICTVLPITTPSNLCFSVGAVSSDGEECCHTAEPICSQIQPCCNPCEENGVVFHPSENQEGKCCYSVDIVNDCYLPYFTKIELDILTEGVCLGGHVINPDYADDFIVSSSPDGLCLTPISGIFSDSLYENLFSFCLDKLIMQGQENPKVVINWYTTSENGEQQIVACSDTFMTDCDLDVNCLAITEQKLECVPGEDKYQYTFTITNLSNPSFSADKLHLIVKNDPANYFPFPTGNVIPLSPALHYGESRTITTCIIGSPFPPTFSQFVFGYRLDNSISEDCCYESKCDSIDIPDCMPPCEKEENCVSVSNISSEIITCDSSCYSNPFCNQWLIDIAAVAKANNPCNVLNGSFFIYTAYWNGTPVILTIHLWGGRGGYTESIYNCQGELIQQIGWSDIGPFVILDAGIDITLDLDGKHQVWDCSMAAPVLNSSCDTGSKSVKYTLKVMNNSSSPGFYADYVTLDTLPGQDVTIIPSVYHLVPPLAPGEMRFIEVYADGEINSDSIKIQLMLQSGAEPDTCCMNADTLCLPSPKCCDPCEENGLVFTEIQVDDQKCCYSVDVKNGCSSPYFTKIELAILTEGVCLGGHVINPDYADDFEVTSSPSGLCLTPIDGYLDQSLYEDLFSFCLDKIEDENQEDPKIVINWYTTDAEMQVIACSDTFMTDCEKDVSCIEVTNPSIECVPGEDKYLYTFTITNLSSPAMTADMLHLIIANDPANYQPFPTGVLMPLVPPMNYGESRTITTCIIGTPIPPAFDSFCITYRLQNTLNEDCCFESDTTKIEVPDCDCEQTPSTQCVSASLLSAENVSCGSSCYTDPFCKPWVRNLALNAQSNIICTVGGINMSKAYWAGMPVILVTAIAPRDYIQLWIYDCDSNLIQSNHFTGGGWIISPNAGINIPSDLSAINTFWSCGDPIPVLNMNCGSGSKSTKFTLKVMNNSASPGFTADYVNINSLTGSGISTIPSAILLTPPLSPGAMQIVEFYADGNYNSGDILKFQLQLQSGSEADTCCINADTLCLTVPPCDTLPRCESIVSIVSTSVQCDTSDCTGDALCLPWLIDAISNFNCNIPHLVQTGYWNGTPVIIISRNGVDNSGESIFDCNGNIIQSCFIGIAGILICNPDANIEVPTDIASLTTIWQCTDPLPSLDPTCAIGRTTISYTMKVMNNGTSPIPANQIILNSDGPSGTTITPSTHSVSIPAGQMAFVNFDVNGQFIAGETLCIVAILSGSQNQIIEWACQDTACLIIPDCPSSLDTCTCGTFSNLNYRPIQGGQNLFVTCGDSLIASCNALVTWQMNGNFSCSGNACTDTTMMTWTLSYNGSIIQSGSMKVSPSFSITIPPTAFNNSGIYSLSLTALCGNDTCKCTFPIKVSCQPTLCFDYTEQELCDKFNNWLNPASYPDCGVCFNLQGLQIGSCINVGFSIDGGLFESPINTSYCYNNLTPGSHQICFQMMVTDTNGVQCFIKDSCITVNITCCPPGDPCANTNIVMVAQQPANCCYNVSIENNYCDDYFKGIVVETEVPAAISQVNALAGWTINYIDSYTATLLPPVGTQIPLGTQNAFTICNQDNTGPLVLNVSWLAPNSSGGCDTICEQQFTQAPCDTMSGCVVVVQDSIDCKNKKYCFKIKNNTKPNFTVSSLDLINITPSTVTLTPSLIGIPPLVFGATSGWICVDYVAAIGTNVCFQMVAHKEDVSTGTKPTTCCTDTTKHCFIVPDCVDPCCDSISLDAQLNDALNSVLGADCKICVYPHGGFCQELSYTIDGILFTSTNPQDTCLENLSNGSHTVCARLIARDPITGDVCYSKEICKDIIITCCPPGDPCANTNIVMVAQQPANCCYNVSIENNYCDDYFKGIVVETVAPAAISHVNALAGWTINYIDSYTATLVPPIGTQIPLGTQNAFTICNQDKTGPLEINISWLAPNTSGGCDTICEKKFKQAPCDSSGCVVVVKDSIDCKNKKYCFKIKNNTKPNFTVSSIHVINIAPSAATLTPAIIGIPPLAFGATSDWICVDYTAPFGTNVCFELVAHKENISTGTLPTTCCTDTMKHCFILPDCDTTTSCPTCPAGTIQGMNLVNNGNFELGNVGFTSGYTLAGLNVNNGQYDIRSSNFIGNTAWAEIDHTNGTVGGKFLVANGPRPTTPVWSNTVNVIAGNTYNFCAWVNNLIKPTAPNNGPPIVEVKINGTIVLVPATIINNVPNQWVIITGSWVSTITGPITIEIVNTQTAQDADLGVDDISFVECSNCAVGNPCPTTNITVSNDPVVGDTCCYDVTIENGFCANYFKGIRIVLTAPSTVSQITAASGWYINAISADSAEVFPIGGLVPLDTLKAFTICPNSATNSFNFTMTWLVPNASGGCDEVCPQTIQRSCAMDNQCVQIVEDSIDCINNKHCFKVKNTSKPGFTITSIDLIGISPSGAVLQPNPQGIPPLVPGATSDWICYTYSNVQSSDTVCYYVVAHKENVANNEPPTTCCADTIKHCFVVPKKPCDPIGGNCCNISQDSLNKLINLVKVKTNNNNCNVCADYKLDSCTYLKVDFGNGIMQTYNPGSKDTICQIINSTGIFNGTVKFKMYRLKPNGDTCLVANKNLPYSLDCGNPSGGCCNITQANLNAQLNTLMNSITNNDCEACIATSIDTCAMISIDWGDAKDTIITNLTNKTICHNYDNDGTYTISVTLSKLDAANNKCIEATATKLIITENCIQDSLCDVGKITVFNALSPNGDGLNDLLNIINSPNCGRIDISIYNRWGQLVWSEADYKNTWSGDSNQNGPLPDGTYYLILSLPDLKQNNVKPIQTFIDLRRD